MGKDKDNGGKGSGCLAGVRKQTKAGGCTFVLLDGRVLAVLGLIWA